MVPRFVCTLSAAGHFDQSNRAALAGQSPVRAPRPGSEATSPGAESASEGPGAAGRPTCRPVELYRGWCRPSGSRPEVRLCAAPGSPCFPVECAPERRCLAQTSKAWMIASRVVRPWLTASVLMRRLSASDSRTNNGFISSLGIANHDNH
jgi:hypothetical protein